MDLHDNDMNAPFKLQSAILIFYYELDPDDREIYNDLLSFMHKDFSKKS